MNVALGINIFKNMADSFAGNKLIILGNIMQHL